MEGTGGESAPRRSLTRALVGFTLMVITLFVAFVLLDGGWTLGLVVLASCFLGAGLWPVRNRPADR